MRQFADFVSMRKQPGGGDGFFVGEGLTISRDGRVMLTFAPDSPLYVNARGEIALRVGDGLTSTPGSPVSLKADTEELDAEIERLQAKTVANEKAVKGQASTIAVHASDLAAIKVKTNKLPQSAVPDPANGTIEATGVDTGLVITVLTLINFNTLRDSHNAMVDAYNDLRTKFETLHASHLALLSRLRTAGVIST